MRGVQPFVAIKNWRLSPIVRFHFNHWWLPTIEGYQLNDSYQLKHWWLATTGNYQPVPTGGCQPVVVISQFHSPRALPLFIGQGQLSLSSIYGCVENIKVTIQLPKPKGGSPVTCAFHLGTVPGLQAMLDQEVLEQAVKGTVFRSSKRCQPKHRLRFSAEPFKLLIAFIWRGLNHVQPYLMVQPNS